MPDHTDQPSAPIRVLIADDHGILRAGLKALLAAEAGFEVAGEASDGPELLRLAEHAQPDVVLLDISMPGMNGIEAARLLKQKVPAVKVLILTVNEDKNLLQEAIHAGASGFLLKRALGEELFTALRGVMRGELYIHGSMLRALLEETPPPPQAAADALAELTPREVEVLQMIARGYTNTQIAELLSISQRTVEFHRSNITGKLGLRSRVALVRFATQHGLVDFESE